MILKPQSRKRGSLMIISDLILLLQDELKTEGDIPVCVLRKTNPGHLVAVDIKTSTVCLVNSPHKYILLLE